MNEATSTLDDSAGLSSVSQLSGAIAIYRLLLLLPVEYLSRSSRVDFVKRALVADDLFSHLSVDSEHASNYVDQSLTILRMFINRVLNHVGYVEQSVSVTVFGHMVLFIVFYQAERLYKHLEHLLMAQNFRSQPTIAYISVTIEVIEAHLRYVNFHHF
jgi:hypothetical protein